jgi:uncharacterized membrane protein
MHFVRHLQAALVWLNLLFPMSISVLPFSCALLGHFIRNPAAQQVYFGNMLAAASLLWVQWLIAKKRQLINEDDPRAAKAMGQQLVMFPVALTAGMIAAGYRPLLGFYAMTVTLLGLRLWQRQSFRKDLRASPSLPPSAS